MISPSDGYTRGVLATSLLALLAMGEPAVLAQTPESHALCPGSRPEKPRAELGPGLVYLRDGVAEAACGPRALAEEALLAQVLGAEAEVGIDAELAVVFSTASLACSDLFYVPVKNDVRGIGYGHTNPGEVFDRSPGAALQGIAFLNDLPYWEQHPEELRTTFLHEVGHRWAARVRAQRGEVVHDLTGREGGHWSYFLESDGSPLEGNRFSAGAPSTTATPRMRTAYSPLDLYLMGAIPPHEVGPLRLLEPSGPQGLDCRGEPVSPASPPQSCEPKTLSGTWLELGIEDVERLEGSRLPSAREAPRVYQVAAFVLGAPSASWSADACESAVSRFTEAAAGFFDATRGRVRLQILGVGEQSCEDLSRPRDDAHCGEAETTGQRFTEWGCSLEARRPRGSAAIAVLMALALLRLQLAPARCGSPRRASLWRHRSPR